MEALAKRAPMIKRETNGTFPSGVSGNPLGRPKGSRNQITLLKESMELELRQQGQGRMPAVLDIAFELALKGDKTMIKLLLEMHLTKGLGDMKAGQEKVTINVKGPAQTNIKAPPGDDSVEIINTIPDDGNTTGDSDG